MNKLVAVLCIEGLRATKNPNKNQVFCCSSKWLCLIESFELFISISKSTMLFQTFLIFVHLAGFFLCYAGRIMWTAKGTLCGRNNNVNTTGSPKYVSSVSLVSTVFILVLLLGACSAAELTDIPATPKHEEPDGVGKGHKVSSIFIHIRVTLQESFVQYPDCMFLGN
jgi:hypothetical protein